MGQVESCSYPLIGGLPTPSVVYPAGIVPAAVSGRRVAVPAVRGGRTQHGSIEGQQGQRAEKVISVDSLTVPATA